MHTNLIGVQVLRAIAATSVVYLHVAAVPEFGGFGVDIFFVLSGFVMSMVAPGSDWRRFLKARIARIVPLYWIMTTAVLAVALIAPGLLNSTTADPWNYLKSLLFVPYIKENGVLHPMLAVGWTLNYEMAFYLCVAVALCIGRHTMLVAIGLLASMFIAARVTGGPVFGAFYGDSIIFEFALGALAYRVYAAGLLGQLSWTAAVPIAAACYAFMATAEVLWEPSERLLFYGLPSLLLVLSILSLEDKLGGPVARFVALIGDASYATYLTHYFVVEGVRKIADHRLGLIDIQSAHGVIMTVAAALIVGHVVHVWIDRPMTRWVRAAIESRRRTLVEA